MKLNFKKYLENRPLSYSAVSSFEYDKNQWFETYMKGVKQTSPELTFGSMVDLKIQNDPTFIPTLPRYPNMQWEGKVVFNNIPLIGKADGIDFDKKMLADYKTGRLEWDKKRADETDQLTFYLLLIYVIKKIKPQEFRCFIHWLPTKKDESGDFKTTISFRDDPVIPITFETKRTMTDILRLGLHIKEVVSEMESYAQSRIDSIA